MVFLTDIADFAADQSICVCVSYVHVQCRHTVVRHCVQCEVCKGLQTRPLYIFLCYNSMYTARKSHLDYQNNFACQNSL